MFFFWKAFLKFRFCHGTTEDTKYTSLVCQFLKFYIRDDQNLDTKLQVLRLAKIIRVDNVWQQRELFKTVNLILIIRHNQAYMYVP